MTTTAVRGVSKAWWIVLCAIAMIATSSHPTGAGRDVACGDVIVEDLRLEADLTCVGAGIVVGADDLDINLNGHVIAGNGTGIAIDVAHRSGVRVHGGTVRGFFTGVRALNSSDIDIKNMSIENHTDGVDLQTGSTGISIKDNEFAGNRTRGIMMRSGTSDVEVKSNTFTGDRVGMLLFGTEGAVVKDNTISNSLLAGIRLNVLTTGNLLAGNTIVSNPSGIEFLIVGGAGSTGNTFIDNSLTTNTCGWKGPLTGNTLTNNALTGNTTDFCS